MKVQTLFLYCICLSIASCESDRPSKRTYPEDAWAPSTPSAQGVDPVGLAQAMDYLESQCGEDGLAQTMVIKNGYVIFQGDSIHKSNNIYSSTKSFTSTVLGLLVEDDVLTTDTYAASIDSTLAKDYPTATLHHFATMTSGYSAVGVSRWGEDSEDWALDPFELDTPLFTAGTAFAYWDEAQMMFGRLLTLASNRSLAAILKERIAEPIGMGDFDWWSEYEHDGIPLNNGCTGLELSAPQLARFGWLFLNEGQWKGQQIISKDWIKRATSTQVPADVPIAPTDRRATEGSGNYGYNWWTNGEVEPGQRALPDAPASLYYASGFNNNMLFVIPEWDMVVVRLGLDGNPEAGKKIVYNQFFKLLAVTVE